MNDDFTCFVEILTFLFCWYIFLLSKSVYFSCTKKNSWFLYELYQPFSSFYPWVSFVLGRKTHFIPLCFFGVVWQSVRLIKYSWISIHSINPILIYWCRAVFNWIYLNQNQIKIITTTNHSKVSSSVVNEDSKGLEVKTGKQPKQWENAGD